MAVHGFAASAGVLLTAVFADYRVNRKLIAHFDIRAPCLAASLISGPNSVANGGGWINHVWIQLAWQLCGLVVGAAWAGGVTWLICEVLDRTLGLRASHKHELIGLDQAYFGQNLYDIEAVHAPAEAKGTQMTPQAKPATADGAGSATTTDGALSAVVWHHPSTN